MYLLLYQGSSVARPLFFEFPTDSQLPAVDTQFLIGPALMITPVLTEGATTVNMYGSFLFQKQLLMRACGVMMRLCSIFGCKISPK